MDVPTRHALLGVLALTSLTRLAAATEIDVDCVRLTQKQTDEMRARAKLILRSAETPPRSLLVACDAERAWIVWDGPPLELLQVKQSDDVVESTLDALDSRLRSGPKPATDSPSQPSPEQPHPLPKPTPNETPTFGAVWREPTEPRPIPVRNIGGLGVGLAVEYLPKPINPAVGPRLDIGVGWNQFSLSLAESARFGAVDGGDRTFFYDLSAGVGWGAPFATELAVGVLLSSGVEWFNVGSHTVTTGITSLGLRGTLPIGALAITAGVEGRLRFSPQYIGDTVDVHMPRFSALFLLEGVLLVEPAGRR
jgi:hypothetical protein